MEDFWEAEASTLTWEKKWDKVLDTSNPGPAQWFVGGKISFCYNAVDRHAIGDGVDKTAMIYESTCTNTVRKVTYGELKDSVSLLAGALVHYGIQQGDIVLAYLPNILEGAMLYLASSRIGAVFCCITSGTAVTALTERIDNLKPKLIFTTSYSSAYNNEIYFKGFLDEALQDCKHQPTHCIVIQREFFKPAPLCEPRDITWDEFMKYVKPMDCVIVDSNHPLFICYTSGSTSTGKALVFETGGICVGTKDVARMMMAGSDAWFLAVSLGWIMAISMSISGTLLLGKTTLALEGDALTPDPGNYYRLLAQHDIDVIGVPTGHMTMIVKQDPEGIYAGRYNMKNKLKVVHLGGQVMAIEVREYIEKFLGPNVIVNSGYGQSETASYVTLPKAIQSEFPPPSTYVGIPSPAFKIMILDDDCKPTKDGQLGNIVCKLPLPPCCATGIYLDKKRYQEEYLTRFKGYFDTKDIGMLLPNGEMFVHCRSDGLLKVGSSTVGVNLLDIENAILEYPDISEVAVICMKHLQYPLVPFAFYTSTRDLDNESSRKMGLSKELANLVEKRIGNLPKFQYSFQVQSLPKSSTSGKLLRFPLSEFAKKHFPIITDNASYEDNWNLMNDVLARNSYCIS